MRNLLEIDSLVESLELNTALDLCNVHYQGAISLVEKRVYIEKYIDIYIKLGDDQKVSYWCDRLIEVDPNNIGYNLKKATSIKKLSDRAKFYTDLTVRHPYSTTLRNNTANTLIRIIRQFSTDVPQNEKLAKEHLEKSLAIDPSLDNPAWEKSMELSSLLFHRSKDKDVRKAHKDDISELVKTARMRHPEHDQTIELLQAQLGISSTNAEINGVLEFFLGLIEKSSLGKKNHIETIVCKAFDHIYKASDNEELKKKIHNFFDKHISEPHQQKPVTLAKIRFLHSLANDRDAARREFDSLMVQRKLGAYVGEILDLPIAFTSDDLHLLQSKLELERYELLQSYYFETLSEICMEKCEYEQAAQHIQSAYSEGTTLSNYLSKFTYALLKLEDNQRVLTTAAQYSDKLNDIDSEAFIINTQVAAKRMAHSSFNQVALRNLAAQSDSNEVKLCAFSLLDQHSDARRILKKQLDMDPGLEKKYRDWPALSSDYFPSLDVSDICVA
jgi:phage gp46-like protein